MTYNFQKFGTLAYGDNVQGMVYDIATRNSSYSSPLIDGVKTTRQFQDERRVSLTGTWMCATNDHATARAEWDDFMAAHLPGKIDELQIDDDRYLLAEVVSFSPNPWKGLRFRNYSVEFSCAEPYFIDRTVVETDLDLSSVPLNFDIIYDGNAECPYELEFLIDYAPASAHILVGMVPAGSIASLTYQINIPEAGTYKFNLKDNSLTLLRTSGYVSMEGFVFGDYPFMENGTNSFSISKTTGLLVNTATLRYSNRYF